MAKITIKVHPAHDQELHTYVFHLISDDGKLGASGEINFGNHSYTENLEDLIERKLGEIVDEIYTNID